jgi:N6-adenosine-specific RNA methylase IME4
MKRYATLYIDPPWAFKMWAESTENSRHAEAYYSVMSTQDMMALPMQNLMADDCAVFMWICWTHLPDALALGEAWGLEYKTCAFNWVKLNKLQRDTPFTGMGYWTRANSEPCLLFTRGNPRRRSKDVPQMLIDWQGGMFDTETIATPIGAHSEKPNAIYERIEALVGGDYCEVFARRRRAGWDAIGNEIDGRDIRDVLAGEALFAGG